MDINNAFPSKYLKAADIPEGRRVTVVIESVAMELISRTDKRPVVYFEGKTKGLVLNKTNSKMICKIAKSDDTDNWVGVSIGLYSAEVEFAGDLVPALRVAAPVAQQATRPLARPNTPPPLAADDDPFPGNDDAGFPWEDAK